MTAFFVYITGESVEEANRIGANLIEASHRHVWIGAVSPGG